MSSITADAPPPLPSPPHQRGHPLLAWLVIAAAVAVAVGYEQFATHWSDQLAVKMKTRSDRAYLSELQVQGREIVGTVRDFGRTPGFVEPQVQEGLTHGPYEQRLRFVTLVGELQGPAAALGRLSAMRDTEWTQHPPTEQETRLTNLLEKLYRTQLRPVAAGVAGGSVAEAAVKESRAAAAGEEDKWSLDDAERRELREKLDWFGDLALAPPEGPDPAARERVLAAARRTATTFFAAAVALLMLASTGFFLLGGTILLLLVGFLRFRFARGSRDGGIYAETFALWMVVYMALEFGAMFVPAGSSRLLVAGAFGLLSLLTLAWPVWRGVSWRRVRQDLGWWTPGPAAFEMLWGLGGYLASIPLLILGVLVSGGLLSLYKYFAGNDPFSIPPQATHPVQEILAHGSWWECAQVFLIAAVCAPLIEETMFRGVLYRHLREIGANWPRAVSVVFSVVAASFVFAVIHPQGFLGVPMLMALAAGFALTRELRGSLLGSITAHGVNNALVTLVAISMS